MHRNTEKQCSGVLLVIVGVSVGIASFGYGIGTTARIGPGFFPLLLGIVLTAIGVLILLLPPVTSKEEHEESIPAPLVATVRRHARPWAAIVLGMLAFMVIGKYGGLVPATLILVFVSARGDRNNSIVHSLALAVGTTAVAVLVFHYAMNLQFPLFSWG